MALLYARLMCSTQMIDKGSSVPSKSACRSMTTARPRSTPRFCGDGGTCQRGVPSAGVCRGVLTGDPCGVCLRDLRDENVGEKIG